MMKDLKEITDRSPFKVPDNYFEELNSRIIDATSGPEQQKKPAGLYRKIRPFLTMAASFLILAILSYSALKLFLPAEKTPSITELSFQEFSETILNDIDIYTLEERIYPIALIENVPDVSDSDIIDYLILENIDLNDIYEVL